MIEVNPKDIAVGDVITLDCVVVDIAYNNDVGVRFIGDADNEYYISPKTVSNAISIKREMPILRVGDIVQSTTSGITYTILCIDEDVAFLKSMDRVRAIKDTALLKNLRKV